MRARYGSSFYDHVQEDARRSAAVIVPLVTSAIPARSVVDVGCGRGDWLVEFEKYGATDILGIDAHASDSDSLAIPASAYRRFDLSEPIALDRRFDLVVSLEVAEHLPSASAKSFISSLVALGDVVLFSAAIPQQGGLNHCNEQWPEFWANLFASHRYRAVDLVRPLIWHRPEVAWWYAQNALIFVAEDKIADLPALESAVARTDPNWLSYVHPRRYLSVSRSHSLLFRFLPNPLLSFLYGSFGQSR